MSARTRDNYRESVVEGMCSVSGSRSRLRMHLQPRYCVLGTGSHHHSDSSGRGSRKVSKVVPSRPSQVDLAQPEAHGTTLYITIYKAKVHRECPSLVQCLTYAGRLGISAAACSVRLQDMRNSTPPASQAKSFPPNTDARIKIRLGCRQAAKATVKQIWRTFLIERFTYEYSSLPIGTR